MKKCIFSALGLLLMASCSSTTDVKVVNSQEARRMGEGTSLKPQADRFRMAEIVKSKMPIYVRNIGEVSDLAGDLKRKVENRLVQENFIINNTRDDHFLVINLDVESGSVNRGNYYKFHADINAGVKRSDSRNMGSKDFDIIGERKEGKTSAMRSLTSKMGTDISDWITSQAQKARIGLVTTELQIDLSDFRNSSDDEVRAISSAFSVNRFTSLSKALQGVFDCQLIETRGHVYTFRVIYMEKHFPNGLASRSIYSDDIAVDKKDPLGSLVGVLFWSQQ